jgi:hypothetical protein
MAINTETIRGTGSFRIRDGRILLVRVGPANAQRQLHNRRPLDMRTGQKRQWDGAGDYSGYIRRTPEHRGFWAFPYPFQDAFFYWHVWHRHMPKTLQDGAFDWDSAAEDGRDAHAAACEAKLREIRRMLKPKHIWHGGPFYSHIRPKGMAGERNWWRYDCARDFVESARGELWTWTRSGDAVWKCNFASDGLEVFVPG